MQNKKSAFLVAVAATVLLSVLRVVAAPSLSTSGAWSIVLLLLIPLLVATLLLLSPKRPPMDITAGRSLLSFGTVFTGVLSLLFAVWTLLRWNQLGEWPFPAPSSPSSLSVVLLVLLCVFALLGGVFFLMQGFSWLVDKPLNRWFSLFSLAPLAWSWVRICQYEMSYYSSLYVMRHWCDLAALLTEMAFFLLLARHLLGAKKTSKWLFGVSLSAGMLLTAACITRVAMALFGQQTAFENSALITAPDLGVIFLAFGFAKAYVPKPMQEKTSVATQTSDDADSECDDFLLIRDAVAPEVDKGDEWYEESSQQPIELEDLILRMINDSEDTDNKKK